MISPIPPDFLDVFLEILALIGFIIAIINAHIRRRKSPSIAGPGWKWLQIALLVGSVGAIMDLIGEFIWISPQWIYNIYRYIFISCLISCLIIFIYAFYLFLIFSENVFKKEANK